MDLDVSGFQWDDANRNKCQKHGVSVVEIESIFRGPLAILPDPKHSHSETRFKAIGKTASGRSVFVIFTLRRRGGRTDIRPIAARYMHAKEIRYYEEEAAKVAKR